AAPPSVAKNFRRSMWLAILAAPGGVTSTHPTFISAGLLADPLIQIPVFRPINRFPRRDRRCPLALRIPGAAHLVIAGMVPAIARTIHASLSGFCAMSASWRQIAVAGPHFRGGVTLRAKKEAWADRINGRPDPRSGSGLCRCRHPPVARHGHPGQAH